MPWGLGLMLCVGLGLASPSALAQDADSCATPKAAIFGLLYWLQPERYDAERAAACQDRSGLGNPERDGPALAVKLKKVIDARGLFVSVDSLPDATDYANEVGEAKYALFPRDVRGVEVVRRGDRWVFSSGTLALVPGLYEDTFPPGLAHMLNSLPSWAMGHVLGMALWQWIGLLGLLVLAWLGRILAVFLLKFSLRRVASRVPEWAWLREILGGLQGPVGSLALASVLVYVQPMLQLPVELATLLRGAGRLVGSFGIMWLLFIVIDAFGEGLAKRAEETESRMDDQIVPLLRKSLKVVVMVLGVLWVLQGFHVDVTSLTATASVASLGVALAAKDTVANLFGSVMVFLDQPFQIGDYVTIGGSISGTVEEVGFRTSRLRTPNGSLITIPNARMTDTHVENLGARINRRYDTLLGLTYDTPPAAVQAFCEGVAAVMRAHPHTDDEKENIARFIGFGPSSLDIKVRCWFSTTAYNEEQACKHSLNMEILRLAESLGVSFAFPSQSVYIEQMPGEMTVSAASPAGAGSQDEIIEAFGPGGPEARSDWLKVRRLVPDE